MAWTPDDSRSQQCTAKRPPNGQAGPASVNGRNDAVSTSIVQNALTRTGVPNTWGAAERSSIFIVTAVGLHSQSRACRAISATPLCNGIYSLAPDGAKKCLGAKTALGQRYHERWRNESSWRASVSRRIVCSAAAHIRKAWTGKKLLVASIFRLSRGSDCEDVARWRDCRPRGFRSDMNSSCRLESDTASGAICLQCAVEALK